MIPLPLVTTYALAFTKYCFTSKLFCGSHWSLYPSPTPTCKAYPVAILLHGHCAIYAPPLTLLLYGIHHTVLVMAISCGGKRAVHRTSFIRGGGGGVAAWMYPLPWLSRSCRVLLTLVIPYAAGLAPRPLPLAAVFAERLCGPAVFAPLTHSGSLVAAWYRCPSSQPML